jgi:hypothetical protein
MLTVSCITASLTFTEGFHTPTVPDIHELKEAIWNFPPVTIGIYKLPLRLLFPTWALRRTRLSLSLFVLDVHTFHVSDTL